MLGDYAIIRSRNRWFAAQISADTTYQIDYSYNSIGVLDTVTYPTSTSSYRLKLQYEYQSGYLYRIKDYNAPATIFWSANTFSARNQVTTEGLGNGLFTSRAYDAVTGWLKTVQTGLGGGTGVQNLEYAWDKVGNLTSRIDKNQSNLTESFSYDNLYRLSSSSLSTTGTNLTMAYDALGNITSKSDVGSYTYHASKKHQVVSTGAPTGWSFGYDANGNMTSGRGATTDWTSYNYPSCIRLGAACTGTSSDYSSFSYTPDRQYWKQVSNYTSGGTATTLYIGGLLEKVTTASGTDYRHMIRAGGSTIIVSRQSSGTNSINYVTSDHLGSSSAITNSAGSILVNSSFDAFGKRRGSNWSGNPSAGDWTAIASTTRRGFTEHTMLDNLNLTHMNGRVYDQLIGRFMSADPFINEPLNTQNYNRYSYVNNRPLSYVDPSGFEGRFLWVESWYFSFFGGVPDFHPCVTAIGPPCEPYDRPEQDDGSGPTTPGPSPTSLPSDSAGAWSGATNPYCDMSPTGCNPSVVCYESGCLNPDGYLVPRERGLESVSWLDPLFLYGAYGLGKAGCTGDCQSAAILVGAVVTRSPNIARGILATPKVASTKLGNLIRDLYKGTTNPGRVGNGTTADAIRHELATGQPVGGVFHSQKGADYARGLENWLRENPNASYQDRLVAQSVLDDLRSALSGAP